LLPPSLSRPQFEPRRRSRCRLQITTLSRVIRPATGSGRGRCRRSARRSHRAIRARTVPGTRITEAYLSQAARFNTDYYSMSPGMISQIPGKGAKYGIAFVDRRQQSPHRRQQLPSPSSSEHSGGEFLAGHPLRSRERLGPRQRPAVPIAWEPPTTSAQGILGIISSRKPPYISRRTREPARTCSRIGRCMDRGRAQTILLQRPDRHSQTSGASGRFYP
jgi:hypothetical protein